MGTLRVLGRFAYVRDGTERVLRWDRPASLLAYLACRGVPVARADAAFLYRPDEPDADALAYLRKLVFRARAKPWADGFEPGEDTLAWPVDTDAHAFRAACSSGDTDRALALYGGPLLSGVRADDVPGLAAWLELERAELHELWRGALRDRVESDLAAARLESAATRAAALTRDDPLDEDAVQLLLRALLGAGRRRDALRAFATFRDALRSEMNVAPLDATQALADAARSAGDGPSGPPADPGPAVGDRFPRPTSTFVGRAAERARIRAALIADVAAPVTLVGLGGAGKTRLATEAARDAAAGYPGGAVFVPLGALRSPGAFGSAVAEALQAAVDGDAVDAAARHLRSNPALLVLDEFERVLDAAPALVRLLASAPEARALVTSRVPLAVQGERIIEVAGLGLPGEGAGEGAVDRAVDDAGDHAGDDAADVVDRSDAVRLFVERARRMAPEFTPTGATLRTVARVCRRLDGMPLAIELVAAWTRTAPLSAIEEELERRPATVLAGADRDRPERHRDLWTVFDAAWNDLDASVRGVAARLASFPGPFPYEAARAVADAGLPDLLALLDRGLLRRDDDGRYRLHALVRSYLNERGDGAGRDAHARWAADRATELGPDLRGGDPVGALARFDTIRADVEAAWRYACERRDAALIDALRDPVDYALYYRSRLADGARMFAEATRAFEGGPARLGARLAVHLAQYERNLGRAGEARRRAEAAHATLREHGTPVDVGHAVYEVATAALQSGDYPGAERGYRTVLEIGRSEGDAYLQAVAENGLGNVAAATSGDPERAERHHRAALRAYASIGHLEGIVGARINLGADLFDRGDLDGAADAWERALPALRTLGSVQREAVVLANLGAVAEELGRSTVAERRYRRSLALRRRVGDERGEASVLHALGRLAASQGRSELAVRRLRRAAEAFAALDDAPSHAHALSTLARVLLATERGDDAERASLAALAEAHAHDAHAQRLAALLTRAEVHRVRGRADRAERLADAVARDATGSEEAIRRQADRLARDLRTARDATGARVEDPPDLAALVREELAATASGNGTVRDGTSLERDPATVRHAQ